MSQPSTTLELIVCSCGKHAMIHLQPNGVWMSQDPHFIFNGHGWHCDQPGHQQGSHSPTMESKWGRELVKANQVITTHQVSKKSKHPCLVYAGPDRYQVQ